MSDHDKTSLQMRKPTFANNISIQRDQSQKNSPLTTQKQENKLIVNKDFIHSPLSAQSPIIKLNDKPLLKSPTNQNNFIEDSYYNNQINDSPTYSNESRTKNYSQDNKRESIKSYFNVYQNQEEDNQYARKGINKKPSKNKKEQKELQFQLGDNYIDETEIPSAQYSQRNKHQRKSIQDHQSFQNSISNESSQSNKSLSGCSCSSQNCLCNGKEVGSESSQDKILNSQNQLQKEYESNSAQKINKTTQKIISKPKIILHSAKQIIQEQEEYNKTINESIKEINEQEIIEEDENQIEVRAKSITYSHSIKNNLNQLIKKQEKQEIQQITQQPLLIMNLQDSQIKEKTPKNEVIQLEDQDYSVRNRNKSYAQFKQSDLDQTKLPQYSDSFHQRFVQESFTNSVNQLLNEVQIKRSSAQAKNDIINKLVAKSKFKADTILEKALRILLYKKKEQRNNEDIAILQKATIDMNFFQDLLSKKSNVQNNIHQNLCKAMQFEFCKQGSIVFYTGDIPDRFYILLKGEVSVLLKKQQEEIDKLKKGTNIDPTDERKKSKFTLRKFLLFKKFQRTLKTLLTVQDFIRRLMHPEYLLNENQEGNRKISDYFSFNSSQMNILESRNSIDQQSQQQQRFSQKIDQRSSILLQPQLSNQLSPRANSILEQPIKENQDQIIHKRTQSKFFQLQIQPKKNSLLSPDYQNSVIQSLDSSGVSSTSPTLSQKERKKRRRRERKKRDQQFSKSQQPVNPQKTIEQIKKNLLPSQLVIFERKQQEQLKQNIEASSKNISGLFKMPKLSSIQVPEKKAENTQNLSQTQESPKKQNNLDPNAQFHHNSIQRKSILDTNTPSQQGTPSLRRSVRTSFLKRKIKIKQESIRLFNQNDKQNKQVDFQKVRLGVRLAKIFEPTSQMPPLNLGGAKIQQLFQQQNEQFEKILPKLDLMRLENSAHFFDENIFKYFHAINLGEGRVFGDLGILTKKPRAATIVCQEDCYFGVLNVEDYSKILMDQKKKKMQKSIKFLSSTINISLSIEKMAKISQFFEKRYFSSGERIYDEGDQVQYIYLIKKGEVELFRKMQTTYGINQTQIINVSIGIIGAKSYFGEDDTFYNRKRKFTAIAKIDSKILMCKKKDFQKLMNEIQEMYNVLKTMVTQKEYWRDQKYEEMQQTRNQIKKIDHLHRINSKNQSAAMLHASQINSDSKSQKNTLADESQQQNKSDFIATLHTYQSQNHSKNPLDLEYFQSEEVVRMQLRKLEKDQEEINQAISRIKENSPQNINKQTFSHYHHHQQQQANFSYQSHEQHSYQHSPKATSLFSQQSQPSPKNKDSFSLFMPSQTNHDTSKEQEDEVITSAIAKDDFIGSGDKSSIKGNNLTKSRSHQRRVDERVTLQNQQEKKDSQKESIRKRETRDICMGSSETFKKNEKVADRRKSIQSVDGGNSTLKKEKDDIMQGKKTSSQQVEEMLKNLKDKQSNNKGDLSETLTGELIIQSKQPLVKQNSFSISNRTNSLNQLFNSDIVQRKDSVLQNTTLNNSQNLNNPLNNTIYSRQSSSQSIQLKKPEQDNFIFFGQQNAAAALKSKSQFFFTPKHNRIGSLNNCAKNFSYTQKPLFQAPLNNTKDNSKINTVNKNNLKNNISLTYSSGFFKPFTEFVTPLPSPHHASNYLNLNSSLLSTPVQNKNNQKAEKLVVVNHMGKPITFTQSLYPQK